MDFKKLAKFIIILGLVIGLYGWVSWISNQPVLVPDKPVKEGIGGFLEGMEQAMAITEQNRIRDYKRKDAIKVMIGGAIVIFVGIAVSNSVKKKD